MGSVPTNSPVRVFIAGGCYAGIAAAVNLLDLANGRNPRHEAPDVDYPHHPDHKTVDLEITIADERDGYCKTNTP